MFKHTTMTNRFGLVVFFYALCQVVFSTSAAAQTAEVSMYGDSTPNPNTGYVEAYVELFDTSDLSQCNYLCYHYNYSSDVYVYGNAGADYASDSGLGPFNFELPYSEQVEDEFYVDANVGLICTVSGPLTATLSQIIFFRILPFNLHYEQAEGNVYRLLYSGNHKVCAAGLLTAPFTTSSMTFTGAAVGFIVYFCSGGCSPGNTPPVVGAWPFETPNASCPMGGHN